SHPRPSTDATLSPYTTLFRSAPRVGLPVPGGGTGPPRGDRPARRSPAGPHLRAHQRGTRRTGRLPRPAPLVRRHRAVRVLRRRRPPLAADAGHLGGPDRRGPGGRPVLHAELLPRRPGPPPPPPARPARRRGVARLPRHRGLLPPGAAHLRPQLRRRPCAPPGRHPDPE